MPKQNEHFKKIYGYILSEIFNYYTIDRKELMEKINPYFSTTNVLTQYTLGNRLPTTENEKKMYHYLTEKISESNKVNPNALLGYIKQNLNMSTKDTPIADFLISALSESKTRANSKQPYEQSSTDILSENRIKAVVFDFDGTLAMNYIKKTTWESIWMKLGYDVGECQKLHKKYSGKMDNHQEWCDVTAQYFIKARMHKNTLLDVANNTNLLAGVDETFKILTDKNIKIFIVSGSILDVIKMVLNGSEKYVTEIKANNFSFDAEGYLTKINGTNFDFQGKADYINKISEDFQIAKADILFVGNSNNDVFVHGTGAKTLCINPRKVDPTDKTIWDDYIEECKSLLEILDSEFLKEYSLVDMN